MVVMYQSDSDSQDSRLAVAGILTNMANNNSTYTIDGINSGIPTGTTPTLTPTTLRSFAQTLQESGVDQIEHQNQAGFVPPVVQPTTYVTVNSKNWVGGSTVVATSRINNTVTTSTYNNAPTKRVGGRRPRNEELPPEEEERRRVRRERNKLAAARCRKRRMDQTQTLQLETENLEEDRQKLQQQIQQLQAQKEDLEFVLQAHQPACKMTRLAKVKTEQIEECEQQQVMKPPRPNTLSLNTTIATNLVSTMVTEVAGVPIQTPSNGMTGFNFDSLMEGGTGFTPVSGTGLTPLLNLHSGMTPGATLVTPFAESCGSQQRSSSSDMSSPESGKLVSL